MDSEIIAELRVMEFECAPSDITKFLSLQPTMTWTKGEPISKAGSGLQKHQENGWAWSLRLKSKEGPLDFSVLFDDILTQVGPIKERFKRLPANTSVQLACCAYITDCAPAISLDEPIVKLLADISASVDFDIYCLNRD